VYDRPATLTSAHHATIASVVSAVIGCGDAAVLLVADRLRRLASAGAIVVLATHDLDLADGLVTRMALVRDGRLVSDEPASTGLRARYRTLVAKAR